MYLMVKYRARMSRTDLLCINIRTIKDGIYFDNILYFNTNDFNHPYNYNLIISLISSEFLEREIRY